MRVSIFICFFGRPPVPPPMPIIPALPMPASWLPCRRRRRMPIIPGPIAPAAHAAAAAAHHLHHRGLHAARAAHPPRHAAAALAGRPEERRGRAGGPCCWRGCCCSCPSRSSIPSRSSSRPTATWCDAEEPQPRGVQLGQHLLGEELDGAEIGPPGSSDSGSADLLASRDTGCSGGRRSGRSSPRPRAAVAASIRMHQHLEVRLEAVEPLGDVRPPDRLDGVDVDSQLLDRVLDARGPRG